MSLVEQAISRLRKAAGEPSDTASLRRLAELITETGTTNRRLTIDAEGLRAAGYAPETAQDRSFADHYRQIKRPLIQKVVAGAAAIDLSDPHLIMVTSALPGDGKTFTSINLALSIARERDVSVLLIDADAPKPQLSTIFGLVHERGLLDLLTDEKRAAESVLTPTNIRGLSIMPCGTATDGAAELLSSNRMRQIMKNLCGQNPRRLIVLDSSPLLVTNEGRVLVNIAGQIVLVVRAGVTPPRAVQEAMQIIGEDRPGGIVLNGVAASLDHYHGYGAYGNYGDDAATGI